MPTNPRSLNPQLMTQRERKLKNGAVKLQWENQK